MDAFDWCESGWVPTPVLAPAGSWRSDSDGGVAVVRTFAELGPQWVAAIRARAEVTGVVCGIDGYDVEDQSRARFSRLREEAVLAYAHHVGCDEQTAELGVGSLQAHLGHLEGKASWFRDSQDLREKAIDECVRHSMFGTRVSSGAAQLAWATFRGCQLSVEKSLRNDSFALANRREAFYILIHDLLPRFLKTWTEWAEEGDG